MKHIVHRFDRCPDQSECLPKRRHKLLQPRVVIDRIASTLPQQPYFGMMAVILERLDRPLVRQSLRLTTPSC